MSIVREMFDEFEITQKQAALDVIRKLIERVQSRFPTFISVSYFYEGSRFLILDKINGVEVLESFLTGEAINDDIKSMLVEMNLKYEDLSSIRMVLGSEDVKATVLVSEYGRKASSGQSVEFIVYHPIL